MRAPACALLACAALASAAPAAAQGAAPAQGGGPLQVQRIASAFVFQPEARITAIDGRTSALVGGSLGVLTDGAFFAGAGLYTNANREDDLALTYGGLVVGWQFAGRGPVSVGIRGLLGYGQATLGDDVTVATRPFDTRRTSATNGLRTVRVLSDTGFFVAEPQAAVQWRLLPWMAIDGSVGYRATAGADRVDGRLRGAVGSVGVRFGG